LGNISAILPQDVALLDASVEENISRLEQQSRRQGHRRRGANHRSPRDDRPPCLKAIGRRSDHRAHRYLLARRQRIALARALYRNPFVVVMDEPNSNLDGEGESALTEAIHAIKARQGIAIVIAHRPSALTAVDLIAVVQNGKMIAFGPKHEILKPAAVGDANGRSPVTARMTSRVSE
jgi:ABC-type protease/lipase transport system fused ATPase/permease subunit